MASRRKNERVIVAAPIEIETVAVALTRAAKAAGVNAGIGGASGVAAASATIEIDDVVLEILFFRDDK